MQISNKCYPKILIGKNDNENTYLAPPSWEGGRECSCWSFGYLETKNRHYFLKNLKKDTNLYDGIKNHFGSSFVIKDDKKIWTFCELFVTAYTLKNIAEVYCRGGSNYTKNPCTELVTNSNEVKRINEVLLPAIFEEIYKLFEK